MTTDNTKARMFAQIELDFAKTMLYAAEASLDALQSLRYDATQNSETSPPPVIDLMSEYIDHARRRVEEWEGKVECYRKAVDILS